MTSSSIPHWLAVFLTEILLSGLSHTSFTQIVSFGGSLSDTDNVFKTIGSFPPACLTVNFLTVRSETKY